MLAQSLIIVRKDFRQIFAGGCECLQAFLLGLLFLFVFSLVPQPGSVSSSLLVATVFWLISAFALVLIANVFYRLEEYGDIRLSLLLAPFPVQGIWLGKCIGIFLLLLCCQLLWLPLFAVLLGAVFQGSLSDGFMLLLSVDLGLAVLGSLLGTFATGQKGRDTLLTVICFPLLLPLLLGAISLGNAMLGETEAQSSWWSLLWAFDALFSGAALLLFPFVYSGD